MKLAALILAPILLAPCPQEKITLKSSPKAGDKLSSVEKMTMKFDLTVAAGGQTQKLSMEQKGSQKKTMEIQEVDGEKATKVFYHFEEDIEEKKEPGQQELSRREKPLHGRKVTVRLKDGKTVCEGADDVPEEAKKPLRLEDSFAKTFPDRPIAVGETWDVTGDALKSLFEDQKLDGKFKAKLAEVKDFEGRRSAFLDVQIDMKGPGEAGAAITIVLKGTVVVWIERGYTLQAKLQGTMSMQAKNDQFEMSGEGPMTVDVAVTVK